MPKVSTAAFLDSLGDFSPEVNRAVRSLRARISDPDLLLRELVQGGSITSYQAEEVREGRGEKLLAGPYVIEEWLGQGGMGQVFKAKHRKLGRLVALKMIRADRLQSPQMVARFYREARAAARLQHPNIVQIYDAGEAGDNHYMAMEYVEGVDLSRLVRQAGPLPVGVACSYIRQAAFGLQHAQDMGLIHRDIKPSNLVVVSAKDSARAIVKILDFGLARFVRESNEETPLTPAEGWVGTPEYMAPEQARNSREADIRADIYSLGCTLFYALTGRSAFAGETPGEKLVARFTEEPVPLSSLCADVPAGVDTILKKMLERDPADRFQTPAEAALALEPFCQRTELTLEFFEHLTMAKGSAFSAAARTTGKQTGTPVSVPAVSTVVAPGRMSRGRIALVSGMAVAAVVFAFALWLRNHQQGPENRAPEGRAPAGNEKAAGIVEDFTNSIGMKLVRISGGPFVRGTPPTEDGHCDDEGPQKTVRLSRPFYLGVHEVTQAQYQKVMDANPSTFGPELRDKIDAAATDRLPVDNVTWHEAVDFCRRLSGSSREGGRSYRLPTEAEWEFACRAGSQTPFHFGESLDAGQANFDGKRPYGQGKPGKQVWHPLPVGSFPPNAFGLHDMHGNIMEWCQDRYGAYLDVTVDPQGAPRGTDRVLRGGAWMFPAYECRSGKRFFRHPDTRSKVYGFRVACDLIP
jgi:formylglycine-generating enzyme required for sulfatase activity/serine/threonine protein kinase